MSLEKEDQQSLAKKWPTLILLATSTVLSMGVWFSATAVNDSLSQRWELNATQAAWLTMSVQLGFVIGALTSALLNLADRIRPTKLFLAGSIVAALANGAIAFDGVGFPQAIMLRLLTGMCCAAVYPVGMKIMATWTSYDRGLGLGLLVGAVVLGSAGPHLIRGMNAGFDADVVLIATSVLALNGGILTVSFVSLGPFQTKAPPFRWKQMTESFRNPSLRYANLGYLGHMWELYAMWTWIPTYLLASFQVFYDSTEGDSLALARTASLIGFVTIAAGGLGSLLAGIIADRVGRTLTAGASLLISGSCAAIIGFGYGQAPWLISCIAIVWGFAIVADSAQFSSAISELAKPSYIGTQLTTQTALGFLLTLTTIQVIPSLESSFGWQWVFLVLLPGPVIGVIAMILLRFQHDATKLAGGRK